MIIYFNEYCFNLHQVLNQSLKSHVDSDAREEVFSSLLGHRKFINSGFDSRKYSCTGLAFVSNICPCFVIS